MNTSYRHFFLASAVLMSLSPTQAVLAADKTTTAINDARQESSNLDQLLR